MKNNKLIFYGLMMIFILTSILSSVFLYSDFFPFITGLTTIIGCLLFFLFKNQIREYNNKEFINHVQNYLSKLNLIGEIKKPNDRIKADYIIFQPDKILLIYILQYKGDILVKENIYDQNNKILKSITKKNNHIIIDKNTLWNYYNNFKIENFDYNTLNIIPVIYVHDAILHIKHKHDYLFANKSNIKEFISYNILNNNVVFPYHDFINYLNKFKIIKK